MDYPPDNRLADEPETPAASRLWNGLAHVWTGFILGDDYICIGSIAGIESGIGYKITDSAGRKHPGSAAYDAGDYHSWMWRYRLQDILDADAPHEPRPYWYGPLDLPGPVIDGAYYDDHTGILYVLAYRYDQSNYEKDPIIRAFRLGNAQ